MHERTDLPVRELSPATESELFQDEQGYRWRLAKESADGRFFVTAAVSPSSVPPHLWAAEDEITEAYGTLTLLEAGGAK